MSVEALQVRTLSATDVDLYRATRLKALQADPLAFVTTAAEFAGRTTESLMEQITPKPSMLTFGAFWEGELVGLLGIMRENRISIAHRANIFGVSVSPEARGQGCGDALMQAAIAQAQSWQGVTSLHLAVTETQVAAQRLYVRHGFAVWGKQPDAVQHGGNVYGEYWLWRAV